MAQIVVLGCGLMGRVIAEDLADQGRNHVVVVDRRADAAAFVEGLDSVEFRRVDVSDVGRTGGLFDQADLVVGALPGAVGFAMLRRLIRAGCRRVLDISFMPQDPMELDALAREKGVCCVVDGGVAPGLSHMLAAHLSSRVEQSEELRILVGGLPQRRSLPFEYMSVFSPRDVIEEYTRPARIRWAGRVVERPALSGLELVDVPGVGTLEAFLTDGLRSLLRDETIPFMEEKTLRYPGHAARMQMLADAGFFSADPASLSEATVRPVDLTARLLEQAWRPKAGDLDLTVLQVEVSGKDASGHPVVWRADMVDRAEPGGPSSMSRTTGYTATGLARLLLNDRWTAPGVTVPETIGRVPELDDALIAHMEERNVRIEISGG